MKKQLLTTSAIVTASLGISVAALAQAPSAPQPISVTVNGYIGQYLGWTDQNAVGSNVVGSNPNNTTCTNCSKLAPFDSHVDNIIRLNGRANLGDGLAAGLRMEITGTQSGSTGASGYNHVGNTYLFLETGAGTLRAGVTAGVARDMIGSSYGTGNAVGRGSSVDVFGRFGLVGGAGQMHRMMVNPTGSSSTTSMIASENGDMNDNNSNKFIYYSPRIFGVQFGASWAPENSRDVTGTAEHAVESGNRSAYRDGVSVAVNYIQNFAGVDVGLGFGYTRWLTAPDKTSIISGATTLSVNDGNPGTRVPDPEAFQAGIQLGYAGFKVGGGWGKIINGRQFSKNLNEWNVSATGGGQTFSSSSINTSLIKLQGEAFSVGGSYTFGPASISVNYLNGNNDDCPVTIAGPALACNGKDRFSAIGVGAKYIIGPGVSLNLGGFYGQYRGNNYNGGSIYIPTNTATSSTHTNARQSNEGGGIITGIQINF